jgi:hypothetical protein
MICFHKKVKLFILRHLLQALRNLFVFLIHYLHFNLWVYLQIHQSRVAVRRFHLIDFRESARDLQPQLRRELHPELHLGNGLKSQPTLRVSIKYGYQKKLKINTYLVYVGTLCLTHLDKMIYQ